MSVIWTSYGELDVTVEGRLPLLHIPSEAGLYRLISGDHCYVGQSGNVRHRIYEYCRPTAHLEHEHRLHWLLCGVHCAIEAAFGPEMRMLDYRRSQEQIAFAQSRSEGYQLWNLSQHPKPEQYRMLIRYHEAMIEKYQRLLT